MQRKLNFTELQEICSKIQYKHWELRLIEKEDGFFIQWIFMDKDITKPDDETIYSQHCRKWYISSYATDTEIIRTAWLGVQQAEIHEAAEQFLFAGIRIFDPHTDYIKLAEYMNAAPQDVRL